MNSQDAARERIRAINVGMGALFSGIAGVVPLLGIPFAVGAIFKWNRARRVEWNPAADYARTGGLLAVLGLLLSFSIIFGIVLVSIGVIR